MLLQPNEIAIDLDVVFQRTKVISLCESLLDDTASSMSKARRDDIARVLSNFESDRQTASACHYAMIMASTLSVGSRAYAERFEMVGCGRIAEIARKQMENERFCTDEKEAFDRLINSADIEALRRMNQTSGCAQHREKLFLRIIELDQDHDDEESAPADGKTTIAERDRQACIAMAEEWAAAQSMPAEEILELDGSIADCAAQEWKADSVVTATMRQVRICANAARLMDEARTPEDIRAIAGQCPTLDGAASLAMRLAPAENAEQPTSSACREEELHAQFIIRNGRLEDLKAFVSEAQCEAVRVRAVTLEDELCALQSVRFTSHLFSREETADDLKQEYDCPQMAERIDARFAEIEQAQSRARTCATEEALFRERRQSYSGLNALVESLQCEALRPLVNAAIVEYCELERIRFGGLIDVGTASEAELRTALDAIACPELKAEVRTAMQAVSSLRACIEEERRLARIPADDLAALTSFERMNRCPALRSRIASRIEGARLARICNAERRNLSALDSDDVSGLLALQESLQCNQLAGQVSARIVQANRLMTCREERTKFEALRANGSVNELVAFEALMDCTDLINLVRLEIDEMRTSARAPQGGPTDPDLFVDQQAQTSDLPREGTNPPNGPLDRRTDVGPAGQDIDENDTLSSQLELAALDPMPPIPDLTEPALAPAEPEVEVETTPTEEEIVIGVQTELQRLDCYRAGIDGDFGPRSREAVRNYYRFYGGEERSRDPSLEFWEELKRQTQVRRCRPEPTPQQNRVATQSRSSPTTQPARSTRPVQSRPAPAPTPAPAPAPSGGRNATPPAIGGIGF